jgi:26S proteasome regulatory subunit T4
LKVVASGIVDKYIGESAKVIREMFAYAKVNFISRIFISNKNFSIFLKDH